MVGLYEQAADDDDGRLVGLAAWVRIGKGRASESTILAYKPRPGAPDAVFRVRHAILNGADPCQLRPKAQNSRGQGQCGESPVFRPNRPWTARRSRLGAPWLKRQAGFVMATKSRRPSKSRRIPASGRVITKGCRLGWASEPRAGTPWRQIQSRSRPLPSCASTKMRRGCGEGDKGPASRSGRRAGVHAVGGLGISLCRHTCP